MKVLIDEIVEFLNDGWPEPKDDWFMDPDLDSPMDTEIDFDGDTGKYFAKVPGRRVELAHFDVEIMWQGRGDDPTGGEHYLLSQLFRRWKKKKTHLTFLVSVPKGKEEAFQRAVKACGGSVQ